MTTVATPAAAAGGVAEPDPTRAAADPAAGSTGGAATLLSASAGMVGLLSYGGALLMAHLLAPGQYTAFAAAAALVGTAGVASAALVPFPLAHVVRAHGPRTEPRREAVSFAVGVSAVVGAGAAVVLAALVAGFAAIPTAVAAGVSVFALFLIAPVWGFLQGEGRFTRYALLTVAEVAVRVVVSAVVVLAGAGAAGAVGGFAVGAVVVLAGVSLGRSGPLREVTPARVRRMLGRRARWAETGGVAITQAVLSALSAADAVVVALVVAAPAEAAAAGGYQAVTTLAKAPVFVAVGTALVAFPALRVAAGEERDRRLSEALRSYVRLVVPAAAVVATVPGPLAALVLPAAYHPALALLPWLALAGVGLGTTTVLATLMLAVHARRALAGTLVASAVTLAGGVALGVGSAVPDPSGATVVHGLAVGLAEGAVLGAVLGLLIARVGRPAVLVAASRGRLLRGTVLTAGYAALVVALLALTRGSVVGWIVAVGALGALLVAGPALAGRFSVGPEPDASPPGGPGTGPGGGLHIRHLGFEDPEMPGAGGGSVRTREIDRRLAAAGHHVTVVTTRFPGARDRVERHGSGTLRWVHPGLGPGRSRLTRLLGYLVAAPLAARQARAHGADVVVEDFCAPMSSMAIPRWSSVPTAAVVQWLNAREKSAQYRLPLHRVERAGVRSHTDLVAMSRGVADELLAMNPAARVEVIGNGVDPLPDEVVASAPPRGGDVVFVGRLEIAQKGLDLLLDAWARALPAVGNGPRLLLAGTGPDEAALRERAERLGLGERVRFVGWTAGVDKAHLVASARLAVVPSRFETFGIVAVEAQAAGTAVLAYDIPCLREVVPPETGVLVPLTGEHPADVTALADGLAAALADDELVARAARRGPELARRHDWDALAAAQEDLLRRVAATTEGAPR